MDFNEQIIILARIRKMLADSADTKTSALSARYFKEGEEAKVHGVKVVEVSKIAKTTFEQIKDFPKQTIFEMCEDLWKSGYFEEAVIACKWSESQHKKYEPADFVVFERWLGNYVNNWADCDTLCNHTVGLFLTKYPDDVAKLKEWAKSSNRWLRRGSAVSLIIPARKGLFLKEILEIAEILLIDKDDLVQKGYGWMLKAASMSESYIKETEEKKKEHLDAVFHFVMKNKVIMPRTALRYAIEKMPADLKAMAMKK